MCHISTFGMLCVCLVVVALALLVPTVHLQHSECSIVINELNTDEPHIGSQEFSEFIELNMVCPKHIRHSASTMAARLRDYLVIGVQEYYGGGPVVTFSADFIRAGFKEGKKFFVIASKEQQPAADMYFTDNGIGYVGKSPAGLQAKVAPPGSRTSLYDFFHSQSKKLPTEPNALINGNGKSAMAIILLYQRDFPRNDATDSIALLRLAKMNERSRRPEFLDRIYITDHLKRIIRNNLHDMVMYARSTLNNRCTFFESLYDTLRDKPDFVLRPAREWDLVGHNDYSINRCPTSSEEERRPLLFTKWKLGHLTPGKENDCSGAHWILEENVAAILADIPPPSVTGTESTVPKRPPLSCAGSSHRSELARAMDFPEKIADQRDQAVERAEIATPGEDATNAFCSSAQFLERRDAIIEIDDRTRDLQTELTRQSDGYKQATKRCSRGILQTQSADFDSGASSAITGAGGDSPKKKRVCTDTCPEPEDEYVEVATKSGKDLHQVKDWEDTSHFKEEWLHSLKTHQDV